MTRSYDNGRCQSAPGTNDICTVAFDPVSELPLTSVAALDLMALYI